MKPEDFIKKHTKQMCIDGGCTEYQAETASNNAVHEYKSASVIKGGVSKMIERYVKEAIKKSKAVDK